jgi:hypothetical protein
MIDALRWVPERFATWIIETDKRLGMVKLLENRTYANEVAAKLIREKRRELRDGTSQWDVLTLFGSSCISSVQLYIQYNFQSFSQGEFLLETRLVVQRGRDYRASSVNSVCCFPFKCLAHPRYRTILFAGQETTSKTVRFSELLTLRSISADHAAKVCALGACQKPPFSR